MAFGSATIFSGVPANATETLKVLSVTCTDDETPGKSEAVVPVPITTTIDRLETTMQVGVDTPVLGVGPTFALHPKSGMKL